ncbi:PH domain-containing protein [Micromonospora sp. KC606]|uniref:PH domain-containing protein n=1 Tax=Micromonospora sp. KC606 TaxID=2530379 RepID=UPI001047CF15|nr:PH domain-containing protein [Micromonospora sp. KC606]TDC77580.1 PH domain-containing protein [Micromonospora sp. KC606]
MLEGVSSASSPTHQWRVPPALPAVKLVGAVALAALGLFLSGGDRVALVLSLVTAAGLAGWASRDLLAPVRLAADAGGVTVIQGFAGRRRLPWAAVETIGVTRRSRFGLAAETLEIDAGKSLHLFGRYDLDAPPDEVAETLRAARPG